MSTVGRWNQQHNGVKPRESTASRLPDFIIIGAMKAGTSSIFNVLNQCPDIYMGHRSVTEIEFFNTDYLYSKGLHFYSAFFEEAWPTAFVGEVSPGYLHSLVVPERMAQDLPGIKLIVCLRDPIERAYSSYRMQVGKGSETAPFEQAIRLDPRYVEQGRYHHHLSRFLDYFPREQLLILFFESLKGSHQQFFGSIFDFIGASSHTHVEPRRDNVSGEPRFALLPQLLNVVYRGRNVIRESPLRWLVNNQLADDYGRRLRNKIASANLIEKEAKPMPEKARFYLNRELEDDVLALARLTGADLSHWLS